MKFSFSVFIFCLIIFLTCETFLNVQANKLLKSRHLKFFNKDVDKASNVYYKFAKGLMEQLGGSEKDIIPCLPGEWKTGKSEDDKQSLPSFDQAKNVFLYVYKALGNGLDIHCKFKSNLKDFFKKKAGVASYRRIFVEMNDSGMDLISDKTKEFFQKFKELLNTPILKRVEEFLTCVKTSNSAIIGVINSAKGYIKNHKHFTKNLSSFIDYMVETICNWKDFKNGLIFYKNGCSSTDLLVKWFLYGKFVGRMCHIIGGI